VDHLIKVKEHSWQRFREHVVSEKLRRDDLTAPNLARDLLARGGKRDEAMDVLVELICFALAEDRHGEAEALRKGKP
jgi:hypothetical protein